MSCNRGGRLLKCIYEEPIKFEKNCVIISRYLCSRTNCCYLFVGRFSLICLRYSQPWLKHIKGIVWSLFWWLLCSTQVEILISSSEMIVSIGGFWMVCSKIIRLLILSIMPSQMIPNSPILPTVGVGHLKRKNPKMLCFKNTSPYCYKTRCVSSRPCS